MTRFARAKGSKGSNVRVPESGTSWDVMKHQLQSSQKEAKEANGRKKAEECRLENYNQFLQEERKKNLTQSWCEFPKQNGDGITPIKKKKKKNWPKESAVSNADTSEMPSSETPNRKKGKLKKKHKIVETDEKEATVGKLKKKKKKKKVLSQESTDVSNLDTGEILSSEMPNAKIGKLKKKRKIIETDQKEATVGKLKKKKKKKKLLSQESTDVSNLDTGEIPSSEMPNAKIGKLKKKRKIIETDKKEATEGEPIKKKKKKKLLSQQSTDVSNFDTEEMSLDESNPKKSKLKKMMKTSIENAGSENPTKSKKRSFRIKTPEGDPTPWTKFLTSKQLEKAISEKPKNDMGKIRTSEGGDTPTGWLKKLKNGGNAVRRKPLEERSFSIVVGGEELEVMRFDGFPVLAKDAVRLEELRRSMRSKGIPRSEVSRTMQLERRRAEKNLARLKRVVCFNCRKGGHLLAECPELGEDTGMPSTGLCFKCGSTEHNSYDCKVQKGDDFKFSKCFICKEQGHIARQCPDHPKGLYPKGGACKLCGDVTHFKKDCPTAAEQKQDDKIKLETIKDTSLEEIESKPVVEVKKAKKTKLVKF